MQNPQNRCLYIHGSTGQTAWHSLLEDNMHVVSAHPRFVYNNPASVVARTKPYPPHIPVQIYALGGLLLYGTKQTIFFSPAFYDLCNERSCQKKTSQMP